MSLVALLVVMSVVFIIQFVDFALTLHTAYSQFCPLSRIGWRYGLRYHWYSRWWWTRSVRSSASGVLITALYIVVAVAVNV